MTTNQILDDLHDTRRRLLAEAGGTIEALGAALRKRQQESGRTIIETQRTKPDTEVAEQPRPDVGSTPATR